MAFSLRWILATLAAASTAGAQSVTGRITDRTSGFAVAGVVVSGANESGDILARGVSDSASGYKLSVMPGMVKLRFRRIGYAPTTVSLADTINGRLDVTLNRLPTQLPPVKALAAAQCDRKANGPEVLALWDQARSGMLTSIVARESRAAYTSALVYQTSFNGDDELPRAVERVELPPGASGAFVSGGEPAALARDGYLVREGIGQSFLAPDDQVLFDETFLASQCFTLEPGSATDSLVGVRFETAKGRKIVGIEGIVWLRKDPLDLVSVEYKYTNLDRALRRANPGGSINFRQMPNGITMIHRWSIRSATAYTPRGNRAVMVRGGAGGRGSVRPPATRGRDPVTTATETGAVIEMMQWPDVPTYIAPLATVSGVVIDKLTKLPMPNTPVRFDRTPFRAVTNSNGAFTLIDVLPGIYAVDIGDPELHVYGAEPPLIEPVAIKHGANSGLRLEAEGPAGTVTRGCDKDVDARFAMPKAIGGPNAIFGRIMAGKLGADGLEFLAEVSPAGMTPGSRPFPLKGKTDRRGLFRLCGLPAGTVRIVTDQRKAMSAAVEVAVDGVRPYVLETIQLSENKPPF